MSNHIARVELHFTKSTAGTHVFEAADDDHAPIRNIYVKKSAFAPGAAPPKHIVVTVTTDAPPA